MANRIALTLVFTVSFMTFLSPELTVTVQLAPLILFAILVATQMFFSESIFRPLGSLLEMDGLVFVIFLSLLLIGPSSASKFDHSLSYAFLFIGCLILARIYTTIVPIREVLEAYFWSGIVSMALFVPLSFQTLIRSAQTLERFGFVNLQTNLLAFLLAGYLCVMAWKFLAGGWRMKVLTSLVGLSCVVIVFLTSSRGALAGIFVAGCFGMGMVLVRARKSLRTWPVRRIALSAVILLGIILFVHNLSWVQDAYEFVDAALAISSPERGVGSGFTGRFDTWYRTIRTISDGSWLLGRGLRSSESIYPMIDNSYLVILYELGFVPLVLITWRFISVFRKFFNGYLDARNESQRTLYLASTMLVVVLLVTNMTERNLIAVGNPFSLLALLLFAAPASALVPVLKQSASGLIPSRQLLKRPSSGFQASY